MYAHLITKLTLLEWVIPPPVAETVSPYVPLVAGFLAETVSCELPEPATEVGLNAALVRAGRPLTPKLTFAENGPEGEIVTVYDVCEPRLTVWLVGETEIEKSATTRVTCAV